MTDSGRYSRFAPSVFLMVFCCVYILVFRMDWPLFRYYPLHGEFTWGTGMLEGAGPAMAWYGLLGSAVPIATVAALLVPDRVAQQRLRGYVWLFPCAAMLACAYFLRVFFV